MSNKVRVAATNSPDTAAPTRLAPLPVINVTSPKLAEEQPWKNNQLENQEHEYTATATGHKVTVWRAGKPTVYFLGNG